MRDQPCVLVGGLWVGPLRGKIVDGLAVLALVAGDHVDGLLEKVEIEILIRRRGCKVEVPVYECLSTLLPLSRAG